MESMDTNELLLRGNEHFKVGEFQEALIEFGKFLKREPEDLDVITNLGYCLYYIGIYDEALICFQKAEHIRNIALTLVKMERYDESIPLFEKILKDTPKQYSIRFSYMSLLWYLRMFDRAIEVYEATPRLPPITSMLLGSVWRDYASKDFIKRRKIGELVVPQMVRLLYAGEKTSEYIYFYENGRGMIHPPDP